MLCVCDGLGTWYLCFWWSFLLQWVVLQLKVKQHPKVFISMIMFLLEELATLYIKPLCGGPRTEHNASVYVKAVVPLECLFWWHILWVTIHYVLYIEPSSEYKFRTLKPWIEKTVNFGYDILMIRFGCTCGTPEIIDCDHVVYLWVSIWMFGFCIWNDKHYVW